MIAAKSQKTVATIQQFSVAIVVLNWRGLEDTRACCKSLANLTYRNARVFVVDNASGDGSAEALQSEFPGFVHLANAKNLGFSGGVNATMSRVLAENYKYVLLLNNDTKVAPDFLEEMVSAAESDNQIGMVGAKIYYFDEPNTIWFAGGKINIQDLPPFRHIGQDEIDQGQHDESGETGWITGCCLLVRSETIKRVGLLDESFGYYCEDVDWSLRVKNSGWKIWYQSRAKVWHKIGRSTSRGNLPVTYYNCRNPLLVAKRNLNYMTKIKIYRRMIDWIRSYPVERPEKPCLVEGTIHGLLGRGGLVEKSGEASWSRFLVFLQMKYQLLKKHLYNERLV